MTRCVPALVVLLVLARSVEARSTVQEITPADAERRGWVIQVMPDGDRIHFTVCLGHRDRLLKEGTTAQLVVRDRNRELSRSSLGLQAHEGKYCFTFSVAIIHLADSSFAFHISHAPHPSVDVYWINLQKFHEARLKGRSR